MPPLSDTQAIRVERHTHLVQALARKVARHAGTRYVARDELESVGNEALVTAALRYDPNSPASFSTFVWYRIYGSMIDLIRKRSPGRRYRKLTQLDATQGLLQQAAEDQATQIAAGQQATLSERVEQTRKLLRQVTTIAQLARTETLDALAADKTDPQQQIIRSDDRRRVWELVHELDGPDRALIEAIYVHGQTMREYAAEIGSTVSTVSRRHARILERLGKRALARERGVAPASTVR
jgi:RNA polymerase sigma factor FliA